MTLRSSLRRRIGHLTYAKWLVMLAIPTFAVLVAMDYFVFPESVPNPVGDLVAALMSAGVDAWIESTGKPDTWPRLAQLLVTASLFVVWLVVGVRDLSGPRQDDGTLWWGGILLAVTVGQLAREKFKR